MELQVNSHRWEHRLPDWAAAAVAGFAAGAVVMVLELLWATFVLGTSPWAASHRIAAIFMGQDTLNSTDFNVNVVAMSLVIHYALGLIYGVILAAIIAPFHLDSSIALILSIGAVFGLLLYLINFYGMVSFFPWFAGLRGWTSLVSHLSFGIAAAGIYWQLERR